MGYRIALLLLQDGLLWKAERNASETGCVYQCSCHVPEDFSWSCQASPLDLNTSVFLQLLEIPSVSLADV